MKRTDGGVARHLNLALVAALLVALVFAGTVSAKPAEPLAPNLPNNPHVFWGTVTTNRGVPLAGMTVVARAVSGYWTGQVTSPVDAQSRYGLAVPGYDSSTGTGAKAGDQIGFFVNGVQALLVDVATGVTSTTYPFKNFGMSQLNLFVQLQQTITATAEGNGAISPPGAIRVDYGTDQTFVFTPAARHQVGEVYVDGVLNAEAAAAGSYTFANVRGDHTIRVTFIRSDFDVTATPGTGCIIAPSGVQVVPLHGSIAFTIGAQIGYNLADVTVDGTSVGAVGAYTFTDVTADHAIVATCARQPFTVTPGWGTGGSILPGAPQTVLYGDSVTFTIQPEQGYLVKDVLVNGVSVGAVTSYTFQNVTANGTIEASFEKQPFTITPAWGTGGTVLPDSPQTVLYGEGMTFTFQPDPGYAVEDVMVNGVSVGPVTSYTFDNVTADATITVSFKQLARLFYIPWIMR